MRNGGAKRPNAARSAGDIHSAIRNLQSAIAGFTLIEVLVASAILAFLLVVFLSVASFSSQAWRSSQQKMEEFSTARIVMNRIRSDIESMVVRPDLPLFPDNKMGFMTAKRGVTANTNARSLSYVEYAPNSNQIILSSRPYALESDAPPFSTNSVISAPSTGITNVALASGVIGFTNSYLNRDGTWSTTFSSKYNNNTATNPTVAVRVSLLLVSSEGLKHLQSTEKLSAVSTAMAGALTSDTTKSPEEQWNSAIKVGGDIDIPTASSLRAFERVFFLPN